MDGAEFRDLHSDTIGKEPAYTATSVERESTIINSHSRYSVHLHAIHIF